MIVQQYISKPYLIDDLKFDLRIYVLVAGTGPLRIYLYKEGLVRFATKEYTPPDEKNLEDMFVHLTNYAVNKKNKVFSVDETGATGHKRRITLLFEQLEAEGINVKQLWEDIADIIIKTISSVQPILDQHYKAAQPTNYENNMCFEVLGFDILLDAKLKPYLLEVNHTPSFSTDSDLD